MDPDYSGPDRRRGGPDRRTPDQRTKILLVDDHALFRMGMRQILEREADFDIVGEAEDGRDAFTLAIELSPDIVLLDLSLPAPGGIDATQRIKREVPSVGIVALGVSAVFTITGYSDYKDSLDDCSSTNENACGVDGTAQRRDAVSNLNLATIVGGAGAVVLGTGLVLYVTAPSASPGASATQALLTRGIGLGYQGAW